jgi:serine/threonine-protein kinase
MPPAGAPQSQVETAISLPRPDAAALWLAQQDAAQRAPRKNTVVLVAVGLLTALCVAGAGALVYIKMRAPASVPATVESATATAVPSAAPVPTPTAAPSATAEAAPSATASAAASAAPSAEPSATPSAAPAAPAAAPKEHEHTTSAPAAPKAEPGYLTIVCTPFCDSVSDGGRGLGPSPVVHVAASPGQHRITLKRDGQTKVISVIVVSGQVTAQRVSMK